MIQIREFEIWALESGTQLKESGIPQTVRFRNPKFYKPVLGVQIVGRGKLNACAEKAKIPLATNPKSTARNPESMSVLDFLTRGDKEGGVGPS